MWILDFGCWMFENCLNCLCENTTAAWRGFFSYLLLILVHNTYLPFSYQWIYGFRHPDCFSLLTYRDIIFSTCPSPSTLLVLLTCSSTRGVFPISSLCDSGLCKSSKTIIMLTLPTCSALCSLTYQVMSLSQLHSFHLLQGSLTPTEEPQCSPDTFQSTHQSPVSVCTSLSPVMLERR